MNAVGSQGANVGDSWVSISYSADVTIIVVIVGRISSFPSHAVAKSAYISDYTCDICR